MPDPGYLSNAELAEQVTEFVDRMQAFLSGMSDWSAGTATGGPNSDGTYPLKDAAGTVYMLPSPAAINVAIYDNLTDVQDKLAAMSGLAASIELAAGYADTAEVQATDARTSAASSVSAAAALHVPHFLERDRYWTDQDGETAAPEIAMTFPLPGTFPILDEVGRVYRTEEAPDGDNSFGTIGILRSVPGRVYDIRARVRAKDANTAGGDSLIGVSLIGLDAQFGIESAFVNPIYFETDQAYNNLTPEAGWVDTSYTHTCSESDPPWLRARLYYNVSIHATKGNQQFEVQWLDRHILADPRPVEDYAHGPLETDVAALKLDVAAAQDRADAAYTLAGEAPGAPSYQAPQITHYRGAGTHTYTPPEGALYLKVEVKGAGGGGAEGGPSGGNGADGGSSRFGNQALLGGAGAQGSGGGRGRSYGDFSLIHYDGLTNSPSWNEVATASVSNEWTKGAYSAEAFTGSAYFAMVIQDDQFAAVGLSADPTAATVPAELYRDIDFCYIIGPGGVLYLYEDGEQINTMGYVLGDFIEIYYEGTLAHYFLNGFPIRDATTTAGRSFHAMALLYSGPNTTGPITFTSDRDVPALVHNADWGTNGAGGYTYHPGGQGGGPRAGGSTASQQGQAAAYGSGCGGGGGGADSAANPGGGGGEGGSAQFIIPSPAATYPVIIGAGGAGGDSAGGGTNRDGGDGADGYVTVEAHFQ